MKRNVKILVIMLILTVTGSMTLDAQPGMRGMRGMRPDSTFKGRMEMPRMEMRRGMGRMNDNFIPPAGMRNRQQGFGQRGMMRQPGRGMRPGMAGLNNIPNLTDKQKKDIADLKGKQQAEMEKLRIDMQAKMKELRAVSYTHLTLPTNYSV